MEFDCCEFVASQHTQTLCHTSQSTASCIWNTARHLKVPPVASETQHLKVPSVASETQHNISKYRRLHLKHSKHLKVPLVASETQHSDNGCYVQRLHSSHYSHSWVECVCQLGGEHAPLSMFQPTSSGHHLPIPKFVATSALWCKVKGWQQCTFVHPFCYCLIA